MERPAFQLRYTWTGWPSTGNHFPMRPSEEFFKDLGQRWETDGIRFLECVWSPNHIQLTCSVKPNVSPILFTARIKGRLQHALRATEQSTAFSRKVSFRSIGNNSRKEVEGYIAKQVQKEQFVDPRFSYMLEPFTVAIPQARLDEPMETGSGRYWYNLHLVIVTDSRLRFTDDESLARLSRLCDAIAKKKGHRVSARSVMPDHIHIALGGNIDQSPEEIALAYMNNTAYGFGQKSIWRPSYYIGSFGEYDMGAVRSASHSNLRSSQTSWQEK
jgi:REP element-mobilizing transposase RayT